MGDPFVHLVYSDQPETYTDPFFARYAQDLRTSADPFFTRLRTFNPNLADSVEAYHWSARGATHVIECGPGKVLAGTVKRIDGDALAGTVADPASLAETKALLA